MGAILNYVLSGIFFLVSAYGVTKINPDSEATTLLLTCVFSVFSFAGGVWFLVWGIKEQLK